MAQFPFARSLGRSLILLIAACGVAAAQDLGTMNPKPLPPLEHPNDPKTPAKELFGRKTAPVKMEARSIGYYTHGCLAGGVALPVNGPTWQVMRLSRNRNWGHPDLVAGPGGLIASRGRSSVDRTRLRGHGRSVMPAGQRRLTRGLSGAQRPTFRGEADRAARHLPAA